LDKKKGQALYIIVFASLILAFLCVFIPYYISLILLGLLVILGFLFLPVLHGLIFLLFASLNIANYMFFQNDGNYLYYYLRLSVTVVLFIIFFLLLKYLLSSKEKESEKYHDEKYKIFESALRLGPTLISCGR
jgi:hypothetical protein